MSDGVPQFRLLSQEHRPRSFFESLSILWESDPRVSPLRLNSAQAWPRERRATAAVFASLLLHFAVGLFYYKVPFWLLFQRFTHPFSHQEEIEAPVGVYRLDELKLADYLPEKLSPGPGGAPGRGKTKGLMAPLGTSERDPRVRIVSNPPHPDNFKQTILQPASPPRLTIPKDIPLPNLVLSSPTSPPELPKPAQPKLPTKVPTPHPTLALKAASPPVPPDLAIAPKAPALLSPKLEIPAPPATPAVAAKAIAPLPVRASPAAPQAQTAGQAASGAPSFAHEQTAGAAKLVSLSLNPTPLGSVIALPAGNRHGEFSIAAITAAMGSPGGSADSRIPAGNGANGPGGDTSVAAGPGGRGGGGPGSADSEALYGIAGDTGAPGVFAGGSLPPLPPEKLSYPVDQAAERLRRPGFVVSSTSGGGGLEVYGILLGPKVYTIYLPMPGKSWVLQFCAQRNASKPEPPSKGVVRLQMQPPLVPPAAVDQFDFHRLPIHADKPNPMIILHGSILADGTVGKLEILRGFGKPIDDAAAGAFARWRFTPALLGGTPVAVEILVGIPAIAPGS